MSTLSINNKTENLPILSPPGMQELPLVLTQHISSFLTYTPKDISSQELVSRSWARDLPIQHLDLSHSGLSDQELIERTKQYKDILLSIDLTDCPNITDKGIQYLGTFNRLSSLKIAHNSNITGEGFKSAPAPQGWSVWNLFSNLWNSPPSKPSIPFAHLKSLSFSACPGITGKALENFPEGLTSLNINLTYSIRSEDLASISRFKQLTSLNLDNCFLLRKEELAHLSALPKLIALSLASCRNISGEEPIDVRALQHLKTLNMSGTGVRDTDLAAIATLLELTSLSLSQCNRITPQGVISLSRMEQLSVLNLQDCPWINEQDIEIFKRVKDGLYKEKHIAQNSTQTQVIGSIETPNWWEER